MDCGGKLCFYSGPKFAMATKEKRTALWTSGRAPLFHYDIVTSASHTAHNHITTA